MTMTALYLEIAGDPVPLQRHRHAGKLTGMRGWYPSKTTNCATFKTWTYNPQAKLMQEVKHLMKVQYGHA